MLSDCLKDIVNILSLFFIHLWIYKHDNNMTFFTKFWGIAQKRKKCMQICQVINWVRNCVFKNEKLPFACSKKNCLLLHKGCCFILSKELLKISCRDFTGSLRSMSLILDHYFEENLWSRGSLRIGFNLSERAFANEKIVII